MKTDKSKAILMLKTCKGQIDATLKMIDEGRYCVDVVNQILAAEALLKKANKLILKQHLEHCVKSAIKNENGDEKIEEISTILDRIMK
ncbi:MAG: metal-sensing transcriptional repressor [Fusobacteriaceae bacterium]